MVIKAIAAAVGAAAMVVGTVKSIKHQNKMEKHAKAASKFERQKNDLVAMRNRTNTVREARMARGRAIQTAENQGASNTSSAKGAESSIAAQLAGNLSFLDNYGFLSDQASKSLASAQSSQMKAGMWGDIASTGSSIFQMAGGTGAFKGPKPPAPPKG